MQVETVAEQLLFSTLRIQATYSNGSASIGTGCIVSHKPNDAPEGSFLVTNQHVVERTVGGQLTFTLGQDLGDADSPILGATFDHSIGPAAWKWTAHPDNTVDIAVLPLSPTIEYLHSINRPPFYRSIPTSFVPSPEEMDELDAIEDIVFVGYPNGIYDHANNLPIVRKGITATPAAVNYEDRPLFLVDASVFPGSSGSPVFIHNQGSWSTRTGTIVGGGRILFLGVLSNVYYREEQGSLELKDIPTAVRPVPTSREMIDLGVVQKAHTVIETIEHMMTMREQRLLTHIRGLFPR